LQAHDGTAVALERAVRPAGAEKLPLTQKPSEEILEGFHRERI
jgi:hypothetical protein